MLAVCGGGLAALAFSALAQPAAAHAPPPVGGGGPSSWQQGVRYCVSMSDCSVHA